MKKTGISTIKSKTQIAIWGTLMTGAAVYEYYDDYQKQKESTNRFSQTTQKSVYNHPVYSPPTGSMRQSLR